LLKDEEVAKKLAELEKMGRDLDESKFGYNAKIIRELKDIGSSGDKAFALWLDCKKEFDFDQKGKTASEWAEWKRRQTKDANHDRDAGLQISAKWLGIVLMYCNARSDSARNEAVTEAVAFLDLAVERIKKIEKDKEGGPNPRDRGPRNGEGEGEMEQDVLNTLFAKHYKLDATVTRKDGGAFVPGDVGGIYEKMLFPFYRNMKQATNLMNAWKRRIEQETAIAEAKHGNGPKEKFNTEKLPELKWGQAVDYFKIGQEETATSAMIGIIKANMTHPKASQWIGHLTALLKKEDPDALAEKNTKAAATPAPVAPVPVPEPEPDPVAAVPAPPAPPAPSTPPPAPTAVKPPVKDAKPAPERLVDPTKEGLVDPTKETP
jgi:hypothetical protein